MPLFGNLKKKFSECRCPRCRMTFQTEAELVEHLKEHTEKKLEKDTEMKPSFESSMVIKYPFLSESEEVLLELDSGWQVVRHGIKFEYSKSMLRFDLRRKPILTDKRLILLKDKKIDYELPIDEIINVEYDSIGGNPYLRIKIKDREAISLFFVCVSAKMLFGGFYLLSKQRSIVNAWVLALNNIIFKPKEHTTTEDPLKILKIRYAKGELTEEQYSEMKKSLELE